MPQVAKFGQKLQETAKSDAKVDEAICLQTGNNYMESG
jgi:hypothetical protein